MPTSVRDGFGWTVERRHGSLAGRRFAELRCKYNVSAEFQVVWREGRRAVLSSEC